MVIAEVLALAEDGYVEIVADDDGYTVRRGPVDPSGLRQDRADVLAGLFHGGAPARLDRPELPPMTAPHGPISADRLSTVLSEAIQRYGFMSRLRWLIAAGAVLGLGGTLAAMVAGMWLAVLPLATGTAVLLTRWLQAPIRPSGAARAERARLHQLREQMRDGSGASDPALLPWAFLLLAEDERNTWWRRVRPVSDQPHWLTWRPVKAGAWPGFMTDSGLPGLARAVAHRIGP
ncbi:hypothetical protein [Actinoplanes flavus]|uniref:DUF2207 domain-containing protein n=1 Tax=Actinoplanes flavus TaxID=2820290 RepID=A0ABS3UN98_9ACTN|nr:hypothetical protein [Actinoplanes flavus]MBO3739188.1 hypothetical protein [Actinoplanes flavus]